MQELLNSVIKIAQQAGKEILTVYHSDDFNVELKGDNSPLTRADINAHNLIQTALEKLTPDIPVLSEESKKIPYEKRSTWNKFWMVDPLDGTREFVNRNDEFTVNIALLENNKPVLGVVHIPVLDISYSAAKGLGAFVGNREIKANKNVEKTVKILASKSHLSKETQILLDKISKDYKVEILNKGSALKLCYVADGQADFYPRLGPTMEWDTAAAQVVVEQAGGFVTTIDAEPLSYNKENLLNPFFIVASAAMADVWPQYLN